jgi:subtilisin family serine protease
VDEAAAIVYAVRHGAKIVNLSIGGRTSAVEQRAQVGGAAGRAGVAAAGSRHDGEPA